MTSSEIYDSPIAEAPSRPYTTDQLDQMTGRLRSALVSDILDNLGYRGQCLEPGVAALDPGMSLIGYAYTTWAQAVDSPPETPYIGLLQALDAVGCDEVWVISSPTDAALWGELTSTAVRAQGARGSVCDGYIRDTRMIRELGFPVFSRGMSPRDANGRVEVQPYDGPIQVAGVTVHSGDLVVGDEDGVAIIPASLMVEVVEAALEKGTSESQFRDAVAQGMKPSEAYERFQVL